MTTYSTCGDIINTALQELGMGSVSLAAASADQTGYQMLGLLNALGDELLRAHDWQIAERTLTFTGDGASDTFALPNDFGRQVNQTEWAASQNRPLLGPVSPQVWSWSQYGIVSAGCFYQYRILRGAYNIFPVPGVGEEFALYYITRFWVAVHGDIYNQSDRCENEDDVIAFDRRLMIAGLKAKFWAQKGFDTSALQAEFNYLLQSEKAQTQGARVIDLTNSGDHYLLGWQNIPDGSWNV